MSLVEVIIGLAIFGFILTVVSQVFIHKEKAQKNIDDRLEVTQIRQTIRTRLDCSKTLNITPLTSLPLDCNSFPNVVLRDKNGRNIVPSGRIGNWPIQAACRQGKIVVSSSRAGTDKLTGRSYQDMGYGNDLFLGMSSFCHKYFAGACNTAPYTVFQGWSKGEPKCCRIAKNRAFSAPPYIAAASCGPHEYMALGGGVCWWGVNGWTRPAGVSISVINFGAIPISAPDFGANSWRFDCHTVNNAIDQYATANVHCCPTNQY
jgi:hypothetical protein